MLQPFHPMHAVGSYIPLQTRLPGAVARSLLIVAMLTTTPADSGMLQSSPPPLLLDGTRTSVNLATHVAVLDDCAGSLTIEDVSTEAVARTFHGLSSRSLNFGYTRCAHWLRLEVENRETAGADWLLLLENARVDHVDLYREGTVERSGSTVAMSKRPVRWRYPVFSLGQFPVGRSTMFLRLQTTDVAAYTLMAVERKTLHAATLQSQLVLGLYFGIMLIAALLSAIVSIHLHDATYWLCTLSIASLASFGAVVLGLDIEYLWPEHPWLNMPAIPISCGLAITAAAAFTRRFLVPREHAPRLFNLLRGLEIAGLLLVLTAAAGAYTVGGILGSVLSAVAVVSFFVIGGIAMVRGCPQAKYYLLAGTLQFAGVVLNALRNFAILPMSFLTTYGNQLGSTLYVLLVFLALLARFNLLRGQKEQAEKQVLEGQRAVADGKRRGAELRLQALQAQINPHFLFNTLNTIAGLIVEAPERAQGVVQRLSRLFRYALAASERRRVLLSEELEIVRSYLEIEQERFGELLHIHLQVEGDIQGLTLPGLTIQPLVENSIKHGLRPKVEGGQIKVLVEVEGATVLIGVEDDGVGMDVTRSADGHGLHSVRERLYLAFGDKASMTLSSPPGLRIDIRLPAERDDTSMVSLDGAATPSHPGAGELH